MYGIFLVYFCKKTTWSPKCMVAAISPPPENRSGIKICVHFPYFQKNGRIRQEFRCLVDQRVIYHGNNPNTTELKATKFAHRIYLWASYRSRSKNRSFPPPHTHSTNRLGFAKGTEFVHWQVGDAYLQQTSLHAQYINIMKTIPIGTRNT